MPKKRVIVEINGGLGNQLFQIAHGLSLVQADQRRLLVDLSRLRSRSRRGTHRNYELGGFSFDIQEASKRELAIFHAINTLDIYPRITAQVKSTFSTKTRAFRVEDSPTYRDHGKLTAETTYVQGYWQSAQYFESIAQKLRKFLRPSSSVLNPRYQRMLQDISSGHNLCVHVRRGDYANNGGENVHGLMGVSYYSDAVRLIRERHDVDKIFIFSDEPDWCRQNLRLDRDQVVVDQWYARFGIVPYINLMAAASLFVIPNSTFGWWASWLSGEKRQETVAPAKWFRDPTRDTSDLVPVEWTRI